MARHGQPVIPRAFFLLLPLFAAVPRAAFADERDGVIIASLAVQTAMQQAREYLLHNNARAAVDVLEGQLPRADGNEKYLVLLRDAYRAYVRELRLQKQEALCQVYAKRLSILDPAAVNGVGDAPGPSATGASPATPRPAAPPPPPAVPPATKAPTEAGQRPATQVEPAAPERRLIARGYIEEERDPFRQPLAAQATPAREWLARAEQEFGRRNYREAGTLYAKASELDRQLADVCRERWAYCKLHDVVEQLNQAGAGAALGTLEAEVRKARDLAPRLRYANDLLAEIDRRRGRPSDASRDEGGAAPPVTVRHGERTPEGWEVADSPNFHIYHTQTREMAEQVAQVAERTRAEMQRKWFGAAGDAWSPRCDIVLYPTAQDYSRATGAPPASPGHSSFNIDNGRVLSRRIELHCDDPNLLVAVLPHETTHTVLAGNFGEHQVPRWADEGMAVLTEPQHKIDRHLRNLPKHRKDGELFSLTQLVHMQNYPEPRYVGSFYAESVSLVEYLVKEKGAVVFTQFVRDGLRGGYEASLTQHYGYRSFDELEQRWVAYAFVGASAGGVARSGP